MKKLTAMKRYFDRNLSARTEMFALKYWDATKTVQSNMTLLKLGKYKAYNLQKKYGLQAKLDKDNPSGKWGDTIGKQQRINELRKLGYSTIDIARLFNVSRVRIYKIMYYKLKGGSHDL